VADLSIAIEIENKNHSIFEEKQYFTDDIKRNITHKKEK
jgi:hypothetical protein